MNATSGTGQTVTLTCRIEAGSPAPIITWSRGDSPLPAGSARVSVSPDGATLRLRGVVRGDEGRYVCMAHNTAGTDTQSVTLRVYEPPQVLWVEAHTVRDGGDAELRCGARGDPPPTITWMGPLHYDEKASTHHTMDGVEVNASLVLSRVRAAHAGDYSCIATNDLNSTFRIVHLAVLFSPISLDPQYHPFYSWISNPVNLTCEFEAFPAPSVTWTRGGTRPWGAPPPLGVARSVTLSPSHVVSYLEVDAQSEGDFGLYSCTAVNPHGRLQQRVHLHMAECPGVPVSLRVLESHHHEVHVAFEPPAWDGGVPLVATAARWRGLDRPPITGALGYHGDPPKGVGGVSQEGAWSRGVGGVSQEGAGSRGVGGVSQEGAGQEGAGSRGVGGVSQEGVGSRGVGGVSQEGAGSRWSSGSQGSQGSSWDQQQEDDDPVWSTRSFNSTETLLVITGLESNSSYELQLAMGNAAVCWGNYSHPVRFTTRTELAPSAPIISQRPGEPHLVSLSVEDDGGLPVTGFIIRYRPVSQDGATAPGPWREVRGGPRGDVRLVGLQALTRYQAEAYAENAEGRSSGSEFDFLSPEQPRFRGAGRASPISPSLLCSPFPIMHLFLCYALL
ncbi:neural cell adhesion molecule 1-like [Lampetra fluviatilis]